MKWAVVKLGEDRLCLVWPPPGEVLCGDFEPSFLGRVASFIATKTQQKMVVFPFGAFLSPMCGAFFVRILVLGILVRT
jgi:hypothetical protein